VELIRDNDGGDGEEGEERGEKRRHLDKTKIRNSDIYLPESSDRSHYISNEDNKDPRPAKRQKLPPHLPTTP
jgi:hypothetical protein